MVQILAWRRQDDKPLSEPMMVNLLTRIWVIWSPWVNTTPGITSIHQKVYMWIQIYIKDFPAFHFSQYKCNIDHHDNFKKNRAIPSQEWTGNHSHVHSIAYSRMGAVGSFLGGGHLQQCGRVVSCFKCQYLRYLNNPIVSKLGLCAVCWIHFMYHHELWPTSVRHSFSFLNSWLGPACGKLHQKITIPILRVRSVTATILDGFFIY